MTLSSLQGKAFTLDIMFLMCNMHYDTMADKYRSKYFFSKEFITEGGLLGDTRDSRQAFTIHFAWPCAAFASVCFGKQGRINPSFYDLFSFVGLSKLEIGSDHNGRVERNCKEDDAMDKPESFAGFEGWNFFFKGEALAPFIFLPLHLFLPSFSSHGYSAGKSTASGMFTSYLGDLADLMGGTKRSALGTKWRTEMSLSAFMYHLATRVSDVEISAVIPRKGGMLGKSIGYKIEAT